MDSFTLRRQTTLQDFATLLENLCITYMFVVRGQLKSHHIPLIGYFLQEKAAMLTKTTLTIWHEKYQGLRLWLTHARIVNAQLVFVAISNISVNFEN